MAFIHSSCWARQQKNNLVEFGFDGRKVVWNMFLDLLWLSSQRLPETWRFLSLHEGVDLSLRLAFIFIYLLCK